MLLFLLLLLLMLLLMLLLLVLVLVLALLLRLSLFHRYFMVLLVVVVVVPNVFVLASLTSNCVNYVSLLFGFFVCYSLTNWFRKVCSFLPFSFCFQIALLFLLSS